jgi:hypothetical protein
MKLNSKPRSIKFYLGICASLFSASFCVLLMASEYQAACSRLDIYNREFQGWQACQQTKPAYYKENIEAVSSCLKSLEQARGNFWIKQPKVKVAGLFVLGGLISATIGYLVAWLVVWFCSLVIHGFIRWLALCFRRLPERKTPLTNRIG